MVIRDLNNEPELDSSVLALETQELVAQIKPILFGRRSEVQGAALADLVSLWVAGHLIPGDPVETEHFRQFILEQHIDGVLALIPASEAEILAAIQPEGNA